MSKAELTHIDEHGRAKMVNVVDKNVTTRRAVAAGTVCLQSSTIDAITGNKLANGDVLATARIAGIMAAKRCDELIPLCHNIQLDGIGIELQTRLDPPRVEIEAEISCDAKTGAEMEAMLAVSIAALTVYDMIKAVDREARISDIRLIEKSGGKSGHFVREVEP